MTDEVKIGDLTELSANGAARIHYASLFFNEHTKRYRISGGEELRLDQIEAIAALARRHDFRRPKSDNELIERLDRIAARSREALARQSQDR